MTKKDGYYMTLSEPEQSLLMKEALTKMYNYVVLRDEYGVCVETIRVAYYTNLAYFARVLRKEDLMDIGYN